MTRQRCKDTAELLPAFLIGTLTPKEARRVTEHMRACSTCTSELASWDAVRQASQDEWSRSPAPPTRMMARVWDVIEEEEAAKLQRRSAQSSLKIAGQIVAAQLSLVRKPIWGASALVMLVGFVVAAMTDSATLGGSVIAVLAPVVAATGVAFVYGPENDASIELTLSTPTSPRVILLARLTVVFCYDLVLTLTAEALLTATNSGGQLWQLVSLWLGPMLFLSALALAVSLLLNPTAAAFCTMSLWVAKLVITSETGTFMGLSGMSEAMIAPWQSNAVLALLAAVLLAGVLVFLPQQERLA